MVQIHVLSPLCLHVSREILFSSLNPLLTHRPGHHLSSLWLLLDSLSHLPLLFLAPPAICCLIRLLWLWLWPSRRTANLRLLLLHLSSVPPSHIPVSLKRETEKIISREAKDKPKDSTSVSQEKSSQQSNELVVLCLNMSSGERCWLSLSYLSLLYFCLLQCVWNSFGESHWPRFLLAFLSQSSVLPFILCKNTCSNL